MTICFHCKTKMDGKPFTTIDKCLVSPDTYQRVHVCGYLCFNRVDDMGILPKPLWENIVNKEDY